MTTTRYLSRPEVAERLGMKRQALGRYQLPEPDAKVGDLPGWLPATIDAWNANRRRHGKPGAPDVAPSLSQEVTKSPRKRAVLGADRITRLSAEAVVEAEVDADADAERAGADR